MAVVKDLDYWRDTAKPVTGDVVAPVTVDVPEARALVVGPDDILLIVMPSGHEHAFEGHRAHLNSVLHNRFMLIAGDNIMLAKVKAEDWGRNALDQSQEARR